MGDAGVGAMSEIVQYTIAYDWNMMVLPFVTNMPFFPEGGMIDNSVVHFEEDDDQERTVPDAGILTAGSLMLYTKQSFIRDERGFAASEFALWLPIMLLIILGCFEDNALHPDPSEAGPRRSAGGRPGGSVRGHDGRTTHRRL